MKYFVNLAERAEPELRSFDTVKWLDRLETELDNIRAALDWARENNVEAGLRMAGALLWFWHIRGRKEEGIEALIRLLGREASERASRSIWPERAATRGKALNAVASLKVFSFEDAGEWGEESLALFRDLGPAGKQGMAYALLRLGARPVKSLLEESLALFQEVGDKFGIAECLLYLAGNAKRGDDIEVALVLAREHLSIRRELGDPDGIATALAVLGDIALWEGDYDRAIGFHQESLTIFRQLGNKWAIGFGLSKYSDVFLWKGDYEASTKVYQESRAFGEEIGDKVLIALSHHGLGFTAWFQGDHDRATHMIMKALAVFRDAGHDELTANSLHTLGDIALAQGLDRDAHQWYEAELEFAQKTNLEISLTIESSSRGRVAWATGDYELAMASFDNGLKSSQEVGQKHAAFQAFYGLGRVAQSRGDLMGARGNYDEALRMGRWRVRSPIFDWPRLKTFDSTVAYPISAMAVMAATSNDMVRCARLLSAAEAACKPLRFIFSAVERREHDQAKAAARAALGEEAFTEAWEEGKKMSLEEAVAYALES